MEFSTQGGEVAPPRRRLRKRWIAAGVLVLLVLQIWVAGRNAGRVRAVVYNDGPGPVVETRLWCAGVSVSLGDLEEEQSRYAWFRPPERSAVVTLVWNGADGRHEAAWAVERGERLTVRVRGDGEAEVSRQRSLGRRLLDMLGEE